MITETELIARGWTNTSDYEEELYDFFSPIGLVSIYLNEDDNIYEICIYRDCIDEEGKLAREGAIEVYKDTSLTIEELITFTEFIEIEP